MANTLATQVPFIRDINTLKKYLQPLYIIEDYQRDFEGYEKFLSEHRNIVRACFTTKECREYPVRFKFYPEDTKIHELELRHFLYNLYCWYPFCELYGVRVMSEDQILQAEQTPYFNDYVNNQLIGPLQALSVKQKKINQMIAEVINLMTTISLDFSDLMGLTFSDVDFFKMWDDPEYRELMMYTSPENAQPSEIEGKLNEYEKRFITKLLADESNPIGIILRSGTGLKTKQLVEFFIAIGMKPTLTNEVMPICVDNSSLIGGLDRASYIYTDGMGARKPLIMNATVMGDAGYFGKNLNECVQTLKMSTRKTMCNSKHLVSYKIKTKKHLKSLVGKFYKERLDDDHFKILKKTDTHLIGKTIHTKSIITCNCGQDLVCPVCIGDKAELLFDIASGIGTYLSMEVTKKFEQDVLSTKHLLTTDSEKIEFTKTFHKYFRLVANEIIFNPEDANNLDDLAIFIDPKKVSKLEEYDDDATFNTYIADGSFQIVDTMTGEAIDVQIKNDKELFITKDASELMREHKGYISFKQIEPEMQIFAVVIQNNEKTKPLYELKGMLNKDSKENLTIDEAAQKVLDIFVEAGFSAPMIAGEMILNRLFRDEDNVMYRPNFGRYRKPKYRLCTLARVMEHNSSALLGFGFQNLKRQAMNPDLEERTSPCYIDGVYKEEIDMRPLKKYGEKKVNKEPEEKKKILRSFHLSV